MTTGAGPVKIEFWHSMGGHNLQVVQSLVDNFNKTHSNIKVEAQFAGTYEDTLNKTQAAVRTKTAPHIIQIYEIGTQVMIDSGIILPMEDLGKKVANDRSFDWGKFIPAISNYYKVGGKIYSMPFNSSTPLLYYNKNAFRAVGLDPNRPPKTFEELKDYAAKLTIKDKNGNITRYGFTLAIVGWFVEQMVANQDEVLVNNNNGRTGRATEALFTSDAAVRFVKLWAEMVKDGIMINPGRGWEGAKQAFLSGRAAMMIESTAQVNNFEANAKSQGYELGTAFLPCPAGVNRGGVIIGGASLWCIADHPTEELKASWEFLKWLSEADQQVYWFKNTGYFPVTKEAVENVMYERFFAENPNYLTAFMQLNQAKQGYPTQGALIGTFPEVRQLLEGAVEEVLQGKKTPEKALADAASKAKKSFAEYNSLFK
jgi:sn-glycerol 3-phosphate transport system substrate-binding protein